MRMPYSSLPQDQIVWQLPVNNIKSCRDDMTVDIAIIGGGMAGLSVAHELGKRGIRAIVLERASCGSGATGKSSGFVTTNAELSFSDLLKRYPEETAHQIWTLFNNGVQSIRDTIKKYSIMCDYQEQETLILAYAQKDLKKLQKEYEALKKYNDAGSFYTQKQLEELTSLKNYYGAVGYENSFGINGYTYCQELKKIVEGQGIEVFEETPALSIDGHVIHTPYAKITAEKIIVCVDRFLPDISTLEQEISQVQTFVMASTPLTDKQISEIFPKDHYMCWDTDLIYSYFRVTGDKRLLLGGGSVFSSYASKEYHDYQPIIKKLTSYLAAHFPKTDIQFEYSWPGLIGISKDIFPLAGSNRDQSHIYYIGASTGLSVAAGLAQYAVEHIFEGRTDLDKELSPYRSFPIGGFLQTCIGKKASFILSNIFYKNIP